MSAVNRRLVKLFPTSRFRRLLAIPLVALTLAAALQALVLPVYSQIDAGSCAVGGAVVAGETLDWCPTARLCWLPEIR